MLNKISSVLVLLFFLTGTAYAQSIEELKKQLDEAKEMLEQQKEAIASQKATIDALEKALKELSEKIPPQVIEREAHLKASIARGKELYISKGCLECHGGEGQGGKGPLLKGITLKYGVEYLALSVTNPAISHGAKPSMPAFTELKDDEVRDILDFLATLTPGRENLERIERGKKLWNKLGCLACHGIKGEGGLTGPSLRGLTKKYNYEWIRLCVTDPVVHHGQKTMMPAFTEVPFMDVEAVIDYMNTF
ncbi:MAG TPA: c-type cytochrome [Candidatus Hypogeohydataceae bacterium YC41]